MDLWHCFFGQVLARVMGGVKAAGFECVGWIPSPLKGADGNTEFVALFTSTEKGTELHTAADLETAIDPDTDTDMNLERERDTQEKSRREALGEL